MFAETAGRRPLTMFTGNDRKLLYAIAEKLDVVIGLSAAELAMEDEQMANVEGLRTEVAELTTVVDSATTAINGLRDQVAELLESHGVDQATIDEITAQ